ncbi:proline-rich receptor-like protein kinase PERK5 [Nicotiana tomentosiformis]|uniref:proline-rich receptor-like protein kinase PERK5 n=1 Tax=Nicotiana tomentosiformis TaxID=4098 RepID=UPI00051B4835|nr:proline-rich receptor-like protein kinase PERK5 [Nicotiana tomentosiformis]
MQSLSSTTTSNKNGTNSLTPNGTSPPPSPPSTNSSSSPPQSPPLTSPPPQPQSPPPPENSPPPSSPPPTIKDSPPPSSPPPPAASQPPPAFSPPPPSTTVPPPASPDTPPPPPTFSPPPPVSSEPPPSPAAKLSPPLPPSEKPAGGDPPNSEKSVGVPHSEKSAAAGSSGSNNGSPPAASGSSDMIIVAGIAVAGVLVLAIIIVCIVYWRRTKKEPYYTDPIPGLPPKGSNDPYYKGPKPMEHIIKVSSAPNLSCDNSSTVCGQALVPSPSFGGFSQSQFTYEELAIATSGFSKANILGQGGFGYVHKGVLVGGRVVAVKSLKSGSGQGEREFQAEVEIISRVHHRHLVSLVGYCIADGQRMLVYEYVPNKTLDFHLHGKGHHVMDWGTRLKIALGSAKGLAYLHEDCHPKIIHRDIKAANILLEDNFEAKVADFGLAKLSSDNFTHISTRVMGTFGYLAPEYASSGKLTDKSDVFSFGVVLLELITGKKPVDPSNMVEDSLVDWAKPRLKRALEEGNYDELVGAPLEGNVPDELHRLVACAAASTRHSARRRPKMSQIVRALDGDSSLEDLSDRTKPSGSSESYYTGVYNADMIKFRKMVIPSQEFNSSEYGATSEYGLNPSSSSSSDSGEFGYHKGGRR